MSSRIQTIIARNLAGQSTPAENAELQLWLSESLLNEQTFKEYQRVWQLTKLKEYSFDFDKAWASFEKRIQEEHQKVTSEEHPIIPISTEKLRPLRILLRVAAVFVLVFSSWYLLKNVNTPEPILITATQNTSSKLPDGTTISLNAGSKMVYDSKFAKNNREIEFNGQAFFNVAKDANNPFILEVNGVGIEVLGTAFHVFAEEDSYEVTVHLENGRLRIFPLQGNVNHEMETTLLPGEMIVYNSLNNTFVKSKYTNRNYMAWSTRELVFNNTSLVQVIKDLENAYNLDFITDTDIDTLKLTANFQDETPEAILQTLEIIFNLKFTKQDQTVRIHK